MPTPFFLSNKCIKRVRFNIDFTPSLSPFLFILVNQLNAAIKHFNLKLKYLASSMRKFSILVFFFFFWWENGQKRLFALLQQTGFSSLFFPSFVRLAELIFTLQQIFRFYWWYCYCYCCCCFCCGLQMFLSFNWGWWYSYAIYWIQNRKREKLLRNTSLQSIKLLSSVSHFNFPNFTNKWVLTALSSITTNINQCNLSSSVFGVFVFFSFGFYFRVLFHFIFSFLESNLIPKVVVYLSKLVLFSVKFRKIFLFLLLSSISIKRLIYINDIIEFFIWK